MDGVSGSKDKNEASAATAALGPHAALKYGLREGRGAGSSWRVLSAEEEIDREDPQQQIITPRDP